MSYTESKAFQPIGAQLSIGPIVGTVTPTYTPIYEISDVTWGGADFDKVDVTNLNSTGKEKRKGLVDGGQFTIKGNTVNSDAGQTALAAAFADKQNPYLFTLQFPTAPGQTTTGDKYSFAGLVIKAAPFDNVNATKTLQFEYTIEITNGAPVLTAGS